MEISTVVGLFMGFAVLLAALLLGHVPFAALLNPEAIVIVFGGTLTTILISFSFPTLTGAIGALQACFNPKRDNSLSEVIDTLVQIAEFIRAEGVLALDPLLQHLDSPLMRHGLSQLIDNQPEARMRDGLMTEIEVEYREQMDHVRVFEAAGGFAPTMGIIGAVIGLIHTVYTVHDPTQVGQGVGSAFSATLYGVAIANLFLLPIAGKLRQRSRDAWFHNMLILQGLLSIHAGEHPRLLREKLSHFAARNERQAQPVRVNQEELQQEVVNNDTGWAQELTPAGHAVAWEN